MFDEDKTLVGDVEKLLLGAKGDKRRQIAEMSGADYERLMVAAAERHAAALRARKPPGSGQLAQSISDRTEAPGTRKTG